MQLLGRGCTRLEAVEVLQMWQMWLCGCGNDTLAQAEMGFGKNTNLSP